MPRCRRPAAAAAAIAAGLLAACAGMPPPALPAAITPAAPQTLALTVPARGVQIYECRAAAGAAPQWTFVAPEAELLDVGGRRIGSHGAGPHWLFDDGLRVQARVKARADAGRPGAIPWLLLEAWREAGPDSQSHNLAGLRSIVRFNTDGGAAPAGGCDAAHLGRQARTAYRADYLFYVGR